MQEILGRVIFFLTSFNNESDDSTNPEGFINRHYHITMTTIHDRGVNNGCVTRIYSCCSMSSTRPVALVSLISVAYSYVQVQSPMKKQHYQMASTFKLKSLVEVSFINEIFEV